MLPLRDRVDLEVMAMKRYSRFQGLRWGGSNPPAEVQWVYSTSPADWVYLEQVIKNDNRVKKNNIKLDVFRKKVRKRI